MDLLTLDTNLIHEYWKQRARVAAVEELLALAVTGRVSLAVTRRIRDDVPRPPLADRIDELQQLGIAETASVTRLDHWKLGTDVLGSDDFMATSVAIDDMEHRGQKPPDWRDWDHLHAHYLLKRDVFLTWDDPILEMRGDLARTFGIVVMKPEKYLAARRPNNETM